MADISNIIPWIVLLTVSVMAVVALALALVWRGQTQSADLAKVMLQLLGQRGPTPVPVHFDLTPVQSSPAATLPAPPPLLVPAKPAPSPALAPPAPKLAGPAGTPPWFTWALHEIGFHETGNNQGIERYIGLAHCGSLGDPWCAIFVNAALESSSIPGSRSASSQSFRTHPALVKLDGPALGAIAVFYRGSPDSGLGHTGFYRGENADHIWLLEGNAEDMVQIGALPKSSATFGLIGYWWPKSVPLPNTGPVLMPTGSPVHVLTPPDGSQLAVTSPPAPTVAATFTATGSEFRALVPGGFFSSSPFDKSIPASIRTNNPGALNVAEWIKQAPGYVGDKVTSMSGASANSTVIFSAPEYGVAAWLTLLQKYRAAGAVTVSGIITRYGGGQNYSGYVEQVAAWSGLGEQTAIDLQGNDAALLAFAKAMFRYEAGRPSPLSDAQILHGFDLARGSPASPLAETSTPKVT